MQTKQFPDKHAPNAEFPTAHLPGVVTSEPVMIYVHIPSGIVLRAVIEQDNVTYLVSIP